MNLKFLVTTIKFTYKIALNLCIKYRGFFIPILNIPISRDCLALITIISLLKF